MNRVKVLLSMLLVATCGFCFAQQESLPIGPGDQIQIQVLEAPELSQSLRVTDAGMASLIIGGSVKVAGLIPADAADAIAKNWVEKGVLLHPHVTVTVTQFATQTVSIFGQVHTPGTYPMVTGRSIIDVLSMAGGLTDLADRNVTIQRHTTGERIDYFISNDSKVALESSVKVYPGDEVVVPKAKIVYILGDVTHPGGYPMATNDSKLTILQAVSLAGATLPNAVPSHSRLIRKQQNGTYVEIPIQLSKMQKGKVADMQMEADDILYVPFSYVRNVALSIGSLISAATSASIYRF